MVNLELCKQCSNRKISREFGILCGLTDEKPDFDEQCPSYKEDPVQAKRLARFKKDINPKEIHRESAIKAFTAGLPLLGVGVGLLILPLPAFVGLIGLILMLLGFSSVLYAIIRIATAGQTKSPNKSVESQKKWEELDDEI